MAQSMNEALCAACAQPLGIKANWRLVGGRAYHNDCEPGPETPEPERPKETLGERAERAARRVLHGPGQRTLEEDQP